MKEHTRNLMVGLSVIVALLLLGAMILTFAGVPSLLQRGYTIRMRFPSTADAHEGDPVHLAGIRIGRITDIGFTDDNPRKGVTLSARIDPGANIPGNVNAYIFSKGLVGGAYVELKPDGEDRIDPQTGQALEFLPKDRVTVLDGKIRSGMLPNELSELAKNLNKILTGEPVGPTPATTQATHPVAREGLVTKLNRALDALNQVLNKQNRQNLATSLKNLSEASAEAKKTLAAMQKFSGSADDLTKKLLEDAEKMSAVLDSINRTARQIESGEGSAGKLVNDPKLYNSLVESSEQLSQLLKDFRKLIQQWQKQGVTLKLK